MFQSIGCASWCRDTFEACLTLCLHLFLLEHLFEHAIVGELLSKRDKQPTSRSVVLVTNALQFLTSPRVTKIVVLQDGRVVEHGSYADLSRRKDSAFCRFLTVIAETGIHSSDVGPDTVPPGLEKLKLPTVPDTKESLSSNGDSVAKSNEAPKTGVIKTMTEETRMTGHVGFNVYMSWARAAGGVFVPFVILVVYVSAESVQVLSNWFLTYWSSHGRADNQSYFLAIYAGIGVSVALGGAFRNLLMLGFGLVASRRVSSTIVTR